MTQETEARRVTTVSMTPEELRALPVSFSIDIAGRAMGMGRDKTRHLYHAGEFPIKVRPLGPALKCTRHELFAYLGLDEDGHPVRRDAEAPQRVQGAA